MFKNIKTSNKRIKNVSFKKSVKFKYIFLISKFDRLEVMLLAIELAVSLPAFLLELGFTNHTIHARLVIVVGIDLKKIHLYKKKLMFEKALKFSITHKGSTS